MAARRGIDPVVFRRTGAHCVSDADSNLDAPLLPALIPRLGLSLAATGTLAMPFRIPASISPLAFGRLADRWRPRVLRVAASIASVVILSVVGVASSLVVPGVILVAGGSLLQSTLPVNVTFARQIAPVSAATVSSIMMGFAWGAGGLTAPLVGSTADHVGIEPTLTAIASLPLPAAGCAVPLPGGLPHEAGWRPQERAEPPAGH